MQPLIENRTFCEIKVGDAGGTPGETKAAAMTGAVLTLNAGSSSLKLALYEIGEAGALTHLADGAVTGIGEAPRFTAHGPDGALLVDRAWPADGNAPHEPYLQGVLSFADEHLGADVLACVGHRVVHGGAAHAGPALVTPALLEALDALSALAPLHQAHNIAPIRALLKLRPDLPQVACFDTAFHHTLPAVATRVALPGDIAALGVRRYGFHGLSYTHVAHTLRTLSPRVAAGRVIAAHLGAGASLCAMRNGRSVETTMGFTALDGLMMATRCGSIDPGVLLYLLQQQNIPAHRLEDMLYHRSGLLGVSGISGDMRTLHASNAPLARDAIELFAYRIVREFGGLAAVLGGLDGLVFTGGIGEHDASLRAQVCTAFGWLGVALDEAANRAGHGRISAGGSAVEVWVIPADEEQVIAREAVSIVVPCRT